MIALLAAAREAAESGGFLGIHFDFHEFGWDALVAIGTIGLACVTGGLAWSTRGLAGSTRDEAASAWRPVLVPAAGGFRMYRSEPVIYLDDEMADEPAYLYWSPKLENVGPGPALDVRVRVVTEHQRVDIVSTGLIVQGETTGEGPGSPVAIRHVDNYPRWVQVWVDYTDLAGRLYATATNYSVALFDGDGPEQGQSDAYYDAGNTLLYTDQSLCDGDVPGKLVQNGPVRRLPEQKKR